MLADRMRMSAGKSAGLLAEGEYQVFNFGTLYDGTTEIARPQYPWRSSASHGGNSGDIYEPASMTNLAIGDTSTTAANVLRWHGFEESDRTVFVCDRMVLANISWNDINGKDWISGTEVTIDGVTYTMRSLTGGDRQRSGASGTSSYAGGYLPNEWHRYVMNNADEGDPFFADAPVPADADWDTTSGVQADRWDQNHNQEWFWVDTYTWCQDVYHYDNARRAIRGFASARRWDADSAGTVYDDGGFRPCLEL